MNPEPVEARRQARSDETVPDPDVIASFFHRLADIDRVARVIVGDSKLSARLTFRGDHERSVRLDFTDGPLRVTNDDDARRGGHVDMVMDAAVTHAVLLGRMKPGEALGRRQMLLRGSAAQLARFIPLFDFAPVLYQEHLANIGWTGYQRRSGWAPSKDENMATSPSYAHPALTPKRSAAEKLACRTVESVAYGLGYAVGTLRRRVVYNLDLFDVVAAASKGIADALPARRGPDGELR